MGEEDRMYDMFSRLFERVELISNNLSKLLGKYEEREKVCDKHDSRLEALEATVNQWTGAKAIMAWLATTGIAIAGLIVAWIK